MILAKIHKAENRKVISLCDENLVGQKMEDGYLQLDISETFYKGEQLDEEILLKEIEDATSLNIIGEESIKFTLNHQLINENNILRIKNIPHAIIILS